MRTTSNKLIVRIDKALQKQKREKTEGGIYIPDQLMDFTNNLQFGVIVAIGSLAEKNIPGIEVGDVAIFDHAVEFKVLNKSTEKTKDQIEEDSHLLYVENDSNDEIRHLHVSEDILENQLFGIFKNGAIIPYKGYVFCYKEFRQTDFQKVNDIYVNSDQDKNRIKNSLDLYTHEKSEYAKALGQVKLNESTYEWHESTKKIISEIDSHIDKLSAELNKPTLSELTIAFLSPLQQTELRNSDKILVNEKYLYPLDLMGARFILIKSFNWIHAKIDSDSTIIPVNSNVVIKEDLPLEHTNGGIIIPDSFKKSTYTGQVYAKDNSLTDIDLNTKVIYTKLAGIEIFIDKTKHLIMHHNSLMAKIN